ncbi:hypothetical protein DFJ58DRAFT_799481 [Suillus subalutaceus]|uniref:uncharacterized protein n=1 Tax=Suillus subalutaceus TaxID=48586 RepID=UPI001B860BBA|nr:uncharacterized protein DFJ58DRAFT_799481 [Suillus subalutaceus]KAG1846214.1 hypothetical protein DFJ58DRAFT_799481 [Suillus subalutaceus]
MPFLRVDSVESCLPPSATTRLILILLSGLITSLSSERPSIDIYILFLGQTDNKCGHLHGHHRLISCLHMGRYHTSKILMKSPKSFFDGTQDGVDTRMNPHYSICSSAQRQCASLLLRDHL